MVSIKSLFNDDEILVLTLLVKNEADIILDNILYHYAKGVDHIIVTDNGSDDGTVEILKMLSEHGIIRFLQEEFYNQDRLVNTMGRIAQEQYGATMLIHADADEFWTPLNSNSLKKSFLKLNKPAVLVEQQNILPTPKSKYEKFPQSEMSIITKHLLTKDLKEDSKKYSFFAFGLPPKVMFTIKDQFKDVVFGNHLLSGMNSGSLTKAITIYHFPFKSAERFTEKVIVGGEAMTKIKADKDTCWHWRRWYKMYKEGAFDKELNKLAPDLSEIPNIEYERFDYSAKIVRAINKKHKLKRYRSKYQRLIAANKNNPKLKRKSQYVQL